MLSHEEITALKNEIIDECKKTFVQIEECNEKQENVSKKFANDDKRIESLVIYQKINNWLTLAITSGIIALVVKVYLGGYHENL